MSLKAHSSLTIIDVTDGIKWQSGTTRPANPQVNWAYRDELGISWIYDGLNWSLFTKDGNSGETVIAYWAGKNTSYPPISGLMNELPTGWELNEPTLSANNQFIFKSIGVKYITINEDATTTTVYDNWTTPELHSAFIAQNVNGTQAATFYKLFNYDTTNQGMQYDEEGKLYINAEMIRSGFISADRIDSRTITTDKLATDAITSLNYYTKDENGQLQESGYGSKLNLADGTWHSKNFEIDEEGRITATSGNIGGWTIDEDFLKSQDGQIALYSKDQESDVVVAGRTAKDWRIASTNFGVTSAGKVYATDGSFTGHIEATSGKIGELSIEQVEIAANNTGINLISKNHLTAVSCTIDSSTTQSIQITGVNTQNTSVIKIAGDYAAGKYTFNATGSKSNKYFRILFSKNYDGNCLENGYYGGLGYPFYKEVTVPITFDFKEPTSIGLVMLNQYGNQTISGLKLEKGDKASAWTPAPEDTLASNVSNSYSWKFSPTNGIKMWQGAQTTEPIFKVDSDGLRIVGDGEFTGKITANEGKIGNWTITSIQNTEISLKSGDLGAQGSVHLYSFYPNGQGHSVGSSGNLTSWRLLIGPDFGVNSAGTLYAKGVNISGNIEATSGKIGSVEIDNLTTPRRNLVRYSREQAIPQVSGYTDASANIHLTLVNGDSTLNKGKTYYFSSEISLTSHDASYSLPSQVSVIVYNVSGSSYNAIVHQQMPIDNGKISGSLVIPDNGKDPHKVLVYAGVAGGTKYISGVLRNIKLEEGASATIWTEAPEDIMQTENSGSYSWKFSPTEGLFMWQGPQTGTPVMQIKGEGLSLTGTISATGGNIGNWLIDDGGSGSKILFNRAGGQKGDKNAITTGMAIIPTTNNHVSFWAGCPDGMTPWEYNNAGNSYAADTPFFVTSKGLLHCSNLEATGGSIGGWTINPNSLTKGEFSKDNSIHLYPDGYTTNDASESNKYFGQTDNKTWMLTVGSNFGVTKDGVMYAKAGKIGDMAIGELVERVEKTVNPNLLLGTGSNVINSNYCIATYQLIETAKAGEQYTVSLNCTPGNGVGYIGFYNTDGSGGQLCKIQVTSNEEQKYSATFTWGGVGNNSAIQIYMLNTSASGAVNPQPTSTISEVKLEKGSVATAWCYAQIEMATTAALDNLKNSLVANVSDQTGTCQWELTANQFYVKAKDLSGKEGGIMVDRNGLTVTGNINTSRGTLGSLYVDSFGIRQQDEDGTQNYGIYCGEQLTTTSISKSFVSTTSPIRFYSGATGKASSQSLGTQTFTKNNGYTLSFTGSPPSGATSFRISSVSAPQQKVTHKGSGTGLSEWNGATINGKYYLYHPIRIPALSWLPQDATLSTTMSSAPNNPYEVLNLGDGNFVFKSLYPWTGGWPPYPITIEASIDYSYEETITPICSIDSDEQGFSVAYKSINPDYNQDIKTNITYRYATTGYNFSVTEKGSVYSKQITTDYIDLSAATGTKILLTLKKDVLSTGYTNVTTVYIDQSGIHQELSTLNSDGGSVFYQKNTFLKFS